MYNNIAGTEKSDVWRCAVFTLDAYHKVVSTFCGCPHFSIAVNILAYIGALVKGYMKFLVNIQSLLGFWDSKKPPFANYKMHKL